MTCGGWACSGFIIVMMLYGATMKLRNPPIVSAHMIDKFGYPKETVGALGIVEIACVTLYAVPRTAFLGAILLTGYLGGGVATHVRIQESFHQAVIYGVLVWLGLYLRDSRVRSLLPVRKAPPN